LPGTSDIAANEMNVIPIISGIIMSNRLIKNRPIE